MVYNNIIPTKQEKFKMPSYVLTKNSKVVYFTNQNPYTGTPKLAAILDSAGQPVDFDGAKQARQLDSFAEATEFANALTEIMGERFIPVDDGEWTSHRFGVITPPKIGDDVSYSFNGDSYPCGKITKITPTLRVTATDADGFETVFFRRKESGSWRKKGGTWSMIKGIHNERNPHF